MRNLSNHVCVVRLYEAVETLDYVYLAMEHCTKGCASWAVAGQGGGP